jgi:hypothetical protein
MQLGGTELFKSSFGTPYPPDIPPPDEVFRGFLTQREVRETPALDMKWKNNNLSGFPRILLASFAGSNSL